MGAARQTPPPQETNSRQIEACRPWLHAEILVVKPQVIVCLGATAAQTMLGREFRITKHRGKFFKSEHAAWLAATYHPSAILRAPDKEDRDRKRAEFVNDLEHAARRLGAKSSGRSSNHSNWIEARSASKGE